MSAETMKMPEPIMSPATSAAASCSARPGFRPWPACAGGGGAAPASAAVGIRSRAAGSTVDLFTAMEFSSSSRSVRTREKRMATRKRKASRAKRASRPAAKAAKAAARQLNQLKTMVKGLRAKLVREAKRRQVDARMMAAAKKARQAVNQQVARLGAEGRKLASELRNAAAK